MTTPRFVADVNGDGIADIVGFGANLTFIDFNSLDAGTGKVTFASGPNGPINNFGYNEGWATDTFRGVADVNGAGHSELVLSGAFNTQVWQIN